MRNGLSLQEQLLAAIDDFCGLVDQDDGSRDKIVEAARGMNYRDMPDAIARFRRLSADVLAIRDQRRRQMADRAAMLADPGCGACA